jgi:putative membrane protein
MYSAAIVVTWIVAALHVWFFVLQSFLWTTPFGRKTMKSTPEQAEMTRRLAFNQGFYNLILAVGVGWAAYTGWLPILIFFLTAVMVAGIVGGLSAIKTIFFIQALPAAVALVLLHLHLH